MFEITKNNNLIGRASHNDNCEQDVSRMLAESEISDKNAVKMPLINEDLRCEPSGSRTLDTLIKSQVLYQLS